MKTPALISCLTLLLALMLATGCQHPGPRFNPYSPRNRTTPDLQSVSLTNSLDPNLLRPPETPFTLGPGDRIEVELIDDLFSRADLTVGPDGKIYFNLLPGIDVWGMTLAQARETLEKGMSRFIRETPRIAVSLRGVESRRIWMLGRVQAPGIYNMTNATTLLEAIALAGGMSSLSGSKDVGTAGANDDLTDLSRSFIVRKGKLLPVDFQALVANGDLSQNIYLEPDDFMYFPPATAREVYVIGAVGQPTAVPYLEGMTMVTAVANCLGPVKEAYLSHVAIVRGSLTEPKVAIVDFGNVISGQTPDVLLQPHDIVYVPYQPYRYLVRYVNLIVNTFVSSVAINEGVRSVSNVSSTQTGVFIPVGSGVSIVPPTGGGGIIR
ncbi:MAG: Polysaccharide export protein [Pedosphaera sp.]|nr:Polysaccharide export protein [Pedosphaera sp.]